jgi:hypothetical protein
VIWDISKSHIDGNTTSGENRRQKILESWFISAMTEMKMEMNTKINLESKMPINVRMEFWSVLFNDFVF